MSKWTLYFIANDWYQIYKGHRLPQFMCCLTIYNQYEEQCVLMLLEFNTMTQMDSVQSMTWHKQLQVFLFITYHCVHQREPENGTINQINKYDVPSSYKIIYLFVTVYVGKIFLFGWYLLLFAFYQICSE